MRRERLQRELHSDARGHIEKRPPVPQSAVQRRELTGRHRHSLSHKVGVHELSVLLHRRIQPTKNDALSLQGVIQGLPERRAILMHDQTTDRCLRQHHVFHEEGRQVLTALDGWHLRWERQVMCQLKTTQVSASPLFFCPQWQRQLLAQAPGSQAPVTHPRGFMFGGAERFYSLSAQCLYSCTDRHNASSYGPGLNRPNLPSAVRSGGSFLPHIPWAAL